MPIKLSRIVFALDDVQCATFQEILCKILSAGDGKLMPKGRNYKCLVLRLFQPIKSNSFNSGRVLYVV
jgi:hypothetical protein